MPENIMKIVRQNLGLESNDKSMDDHINKLSKTEIFEKVLEWEGFIGYTHTIIG